MDTVTVKKQELIDTLKKNREAHKASYDEAKTNYRQKVVDELRARADDIDGGGDINTSFMLPKPEDHTQDYDDAIASLEWHQGDSIDLDRSFEFPQWVLNRWQWERAFAANTMSYTGAAARR